MGLFGTGVWDEAAFDAADYGLFAALTHPDLRTPELELVNDWHLWGFHLDDLFVERYKRPRDLAGAKALVARLAEFMPADASPPPDPADPVERGLADLWARTAPRMAAGDRAGLASAVLDLVESWLWELAGLAQGRVPDPVDYVEMRRRTTGGDFSARLLRGATSAGLPAAFDGSAPMRALGDAYADIVGLHNDLVSYEKETAAEGELNNGVVAVRHFLGCDARRAAGIVADLVGARIRQFERVVHDDLPALADEHDLGPAARERIDRYVQGLRSWMAGETHWAAKSGRYHPPRSATPPAPPPAASAPARRVPDGRPFGGALRRVLDGPTGLGTSAARVGPPRVVSSPAAQAAVHTSVNGPARGAGDAAVHAVTPGGRSS
ncbi:hypothetical protein ACFQHO_13585 [Actinomadura yumaensis]